MKLKFGLVLLFMMLFVACGGGEEATPAATQPVAPTEAVVANTPTVVPPTLTAAAAPTLPPPVQPTSIPTVTPLPTAEGVNLLSPADFGTTRNPLTGEEVSDPAVLNRRPLAIKISNAPAGYVRPQSGLNDADIIFEHITEAVVTRFTAIFYSKTPATIGPIRSARLIDLELPAMYDAALAYSGTSAGVGNRLFSSDFVPRILRSTARGYYRTGDTSKPLEHTLYAYPLQLWESLEAENTPPNFNKFMSFTSAPPAGGQPATQITIDYKYEKVEWRYDAAAGQYLRWAAGVPHNDGNTNEQVHAKNVVVVYANHENDPTICEQISAEGQCQLLSVQIQLWGQGSATIFRDGQRYDGVWKRDGRNDMLTFYDNNGQVIPLQIGNTWIQVMSIYYENPVTTTP